MESAGRTMTSRASGRTLRGWVRLPSPKPPWMAAVQMGLTSAEMLAVIASLTGRNFYKSMTSHADPRVWQDVYYAGTPIRKDAYIKITLRDTAPVIQFKEK